ncbi:MAG: ornithine carbamoyltransferase [Salinibacterium sp.]|nr:ornithine carbamoyltransferase [Salinibacterium sp.]
MTTLAEPKPATKAIRSLLSINDLSVEQAHDLIALAAQLKAETKADPASWSSTLAHRSAVLLFEMPSLRTRVSFEIGIAKLGGHAMYFDHSKNRIGERESVKDYAKNLERMADVVIARVFDHDVLAEMASHSSMPIINALSDHEHPCQALADMLTLHEHFGSFSGLRLAWVGDGNNVCHSLMLLAAKLGIELTVVTPKGFEPQFSVVKQALTAAESTRSTITLSHNISAIEGHHAVYTDTWVSMGQGHQADIRGGAFTGLQINEKTMAMASRGMDAPALFMHCLPAHRGVEVVDAVIDSPQSVVYDQAENRMWAQNALLATIFNHTASHDRTVY